jgi:hypothetical protein
MNPRFHRCARLMVIFNQQHGLKIIIHFIPHRIGINLTFIANPSRSKSLDHDAFFTIEDGAASRSRLDHAMADTFDPCSHSGPRPTNG